MVGVLYYHKTLQPHTRSLSIRPPGTLMATSRVWSTSEDNSEYTSWTRYACNGWLGISVSFSGDEVNGFILQAREKILGTGVGMFDASNLPDGVQAGPCTTARWVRLRITDNSQHTDVILGLIVVVTRHPWPTLTQTLKLTFSSPGCLLVTATVGISTSSQSPALISSVRVV